MKKRELLKLGLSEKEQLALAMSGCAEAKANGLKKSVIRKRVINLVENPSDFIKDQFFGELAKNLTRNLGRASQSYTLNEELTYEYWGEEIDPKAHEQMKNACKLPISVKGALMPDAHVGYGLPIGGVLATKNAVIPYAVGVDIACRVMLTVMDTPLVKFHKNKAKFTRAIGENTRFGVGAKWSTKKEHDVMDLDWGVSPITKKLKDLAWAQLGTSGSGNHFVEFGEFELLAERDDLEPGRYLAVVSHSGSRGTGNQVATFYSNLARALHPNLPKGLKHLAWLSMEGEGKEYWDAMKLMGEYASATHHIIHKSLLRELGAKKIFQVENHHNFAWKETHDGEEVVVHRKGATPADKGVLGYVPGDMVAPGYLVEGLGNPLSLNSCSHGAGRQLSRKQAKNSMTMHELKKILKDKKVELISAGLDEAPHAYKDIETVMRNQSSLVKKIARFTPRLVKMAPAGEKAEC